MFLAPSHSDPGESLLTTTLLGVYLGEPAGKTPTHMSPSDLDAWCSRFVHVSACYWTTRPFLVLLHGHSGSPRVRNLDGTCVNYMSTFIQIHFITEPIKQHYYSEKLALLFWQSKPQSKKLQPNKFITQPNELEATKSARHNQISSSDQDTQDQGWQAILEETS